MRLVVQLPARGQERQHAAGAHSPAAAAAAEGATSAAQAVPCAASRVRADVGGSIPRPAQRDVRLGGLRAGPPARPQQQVSTDAAAAVGAAQARTAAAERQPRTPQDDGRSSASTVSAPSSDTQPLAGSASSDSSRSCVKPQSFSRLQCAAFAAPQHGRATLYAGGSCPTRALLPPPRAPVKLVLRHFDQRWREAVGHDEREARKLAPAGRQALLKVAGHSQVERQVGHRVAPREQEQAPGVAAGAERGAVGAVRGVLLEREPVVNLPAEAAAARIAAAGHHAGAEAVSACAAGWRPPTSVHASASQGCAQGRRA
jgi:hypothetical protein